MRPLFLAATVLALACHFPAPAVASPFGEFNVFAWRVTRSGVARQTTPPDILIGTAHFQVETQEDVPGGLKELMRDCSAFAMETDLSRFKPEQVERQLALPPGADLRELLPERTWQALVAGYGPMGVPLDQLAHSKPWLLSFLFADTSSLETGLDGRLRRMAAEDGKKLYYLEEMDAQIRALDAGTLKERLDMLVRSVDDPETTTDGLSAVVEAYKTGSLAATGGLVFDEDMMRAYPVYYKQLFDERNTAWLPKIDYLFQHEDAVVAVGLGHVIGPGGLLSMLKARGYNAEPIPFD